MNTAIKRVNVFGVVRRQLTRNDTKALVRSFGAGHGHDDHGHHEHKVRHFFRRRKKSDLAVF